MKGLDRFVEARIDGRLLAKQVLLFVGTDGSKWWQWRELFVIPNGRIDSAREDMRALLGIDVTLVAQTYDKTAAAIFDRMQEYAASIVLVCLDLEDGLVWVKGHEARSL